MPHTQASVHVPLVEKPQAGLNKNNWRYLRHCFLLFFVIFGLVNIIGGRVFIGHALDHNPSLMKRVIFKTWIDELWPSIPPSPMSWPMPDHVALYQGNQSWIKAQIAVAYEGDKRYWMEVIGFGAPLHGYEIRTLRVHDLGVLVYADPPYGESPRIRFSLLGTLANTLIYTLFMWVIFGLAPILLILLERWHESRKWTEEWMCPGCGYDVQDLAICPECGRPNERSAGDLAQATAIE